MKVKKCIVLFAVLAVVLWVFPAAAQDQWEFYGSARMETFYNAGKAATLMNAHDNGNLNEDDAETEWRLSPIARIGAKVKHGHVSGYFEYGPGVNLRKLYATWRPWGDQSLELLVGQTYTPINVFYSGQTYAADEGLLSTGQMYDGRHPMVQLGYRGFKLAFVNVNKADNLGTTFPSEPGGDLDSPGDVDVLLPKIAASYHYGGDNFFFDLVGGYQTYRIENPNGFGSDLNVDSFVFGGGGGVSFGPAYFKAAGYYGRNIGNYGMWTNANGYFGKPILKPGAPVAGLWTVDAASAVVTYNRDAAGGLRYDTEDTTVWSALGVVGFNVNDMVRLEAGVGYIDYDNDYFIADGKVTAAYLQAPITFAKGVFVVPEIGYYDIDSRLDMLDDNGAARDGEDFWYIGAKWQINF